MTLLSYKTEYEQANELFRHYQKMQYAIAPLFISAFALLALGWMLVFQLYQLLSLGFVSIVLFLVWFNINEHYSKRILIILAKMRELEEFIGVSLYRSLREELRVGSSHGVEAAISFFPDGSLVIISILWMVRLILLIAK